LAKLCIFAPLHVGLERMIPRNVLYQILDFCVPVVLNFWARCESRYAAMNCDIIDVA